MGEPVSAVAAFAAGLLSFFSPCVLPLVPIYLGYMAGTASSNANRAGKLHLVIHAAFFVLGFGIIFVLLGAAAGLLGGLLGRILPILVRIGGLILVVLGLHMCELVKIPFLNMDKHLDLGHPGKGYWASLLVGIIFAAGWTPCIGPVLASILMLAANSQTLQSGALLLGVYSLGLGLPFVATGALFNLALPLIKKMGRWTRVFSIVGGSLLIIMGLLLATGLFTQISNWVNSLAA
ncbi:MAG: cytochrome c biogenesis protein CcdA [Chloroflexi bacterium]|nr:cytochrome c biogenesis protein CcdA [Chloroflexota bacterium]